MRKICVLEDKICDDCQSCNYCDLDSSKICDNCCTCLGEAEFNGVLVDEILLDAENLLKK